MVRLAAISIALMSFVGAATADPVLERGAYLVTGVMNCGNCHSPKGPPAAVAGKDFSGGLSWDLPPFKVTAANITQDKETGIGNWTDADIKKLLRTGMRPNGTPIAAIMPTGFYGIIAESDMDAIVAFLRTVAPVSNAVPAPVYHFAVPPQVFPGTEQPYTQAVMDDKLKRGFYLASIGHCMECHTPQVKGHHDFVNDAGKGGMEFPGPWGVSVSANITSSKTKGIGGWTDAEIKHAITDGIDKDGKKLNGPMGYPYYAKMTDADLDAVVAWLRTVPPRE